MARPCWLSLIVNTLTDLDRNQTFDHDPYFFFVITLNSCKRFAAGATIYQEKQTKKFNMVEGLREETRKKST